MSDEEEAPQPQKTKAKETKPVAGKRAKTEPEAEAEEAVEEVQEEVKVSVWKAKFVR